MRPSDRKIDQKTGRAVNRRLVLNLVRKSDGLSRSELSAQTGLSAAAVGFVVSDLMDDGLLVEGKPTGKGSGRRPVPLTLNSSGHLAIGLKLSVDRIDCILTDLSIAVIDQTSVRLPRMSPEAVVGAANEAVSQLVAASGKGRPIIGVGLSMPGRLDIDTGMCIRSHRFDWHDVPIGPMMAQALGLPVAIEDDTLAFGLAHHLFGLGQSNQTFAALAVGEGIGLAAITEDRVRRGSIGNAGKVGHVLHREDGPMCECGRRGCLQAWYSAAALDRRWRETSPDQSIYDAIAARNGDALDLVREAARAIGFHLAEWVTVLDPERVVLGGEGIEFGPDFLSVMQDTLRHAYFRETAPEIVADDSSFYWTAGAAAVAVQRIFDFETEAAP